MKVQFETTKVEDVEHARRLLAQLGATSGGHRHMGLDALVQLLQLARDRSKIQCIKLIRDVYGLGLKEAKEWVEDNLKI